MILDLIGTATEYVTNVFDNPKKEIRKRKNFLSEFLFPYEEDFKIIDAYTEKVNEGIVLVSIKQYRENPEFVLIREQISIFENEQVSKLERKQAKIKRRNWMVFILFIFGHLIFYGVLFFRGFYE
jgi:hypothetical protein